MSDHIVLQTIGNILIIVLFSVLSYFKALEALEIRRRRKESNAAEKDMPK